MIFRGCIVLGVILCCVNLLEVTGFSEAEQSGGPISLSDLIDQKYKSTRRLRHTLRHDGGNGECADIFCGQCVIDCNGTIGGNAHEDDGGNCCKEKDIDCNGICNGGAAIDVCGICSGGTTQLVPGETCIDHPEGCSAWCIISIVLTSTAALGAAIIITMICCCFKVFPADDPTRRRRPREDEYRYRNKTAGRRVGLRMRGKPFSGSSNKRERVALIGNRNVVHRGIKMRQKKGKRK